MFAMMVGILVVAVVVATALVLLFRPVFDEGGRSATGSSEPATGGENGPQAGAGDSLAERYARGDIDRAEFLARRDESGK